jgi:drug/metabolite transporter (DMT)-like permease
MRARLAPITFVYLTLPPLMWASNAIVGRLAVAGASPLISPLTLNALRWVVTLAILAVVAALVAWRDAAGAGPRRDAAPTDEAGAAVEAIAGSWRIYAVFGLLAVASYNALQYVALRTSSAINVTLIASGGPLFVLLIGRLFFGAHARRWAWLGAGLSLVGVFVVLTGGDLERLARLRLAGGDLLMVAATIVWALYSWLLRRRRPDVPVLTLLLLQTAWGVALSVPVVALEWFAGDFVLQVDARTAAVVLWVALGPSLLAYWCWDRGIASAGPVLPTFFANLTPLFAALMSAALLGEPPQGFHAVAFALIAGGIAVSQRGARAH